MIEVLIDDQWVIQQPKHGDKYKETKTNGAVIISFWNEPAENKYSVSNVSLTVNGGEPLPFSSVYFVSDNDALSMSADLVGDSGVLQTQLDQTGLGYPPILALPVTKYAGGDSGTVIDEVYFQASLVNGVIATSGVLPSKGNWKLKTERINESLKAIGADWGIDSLNVDFIVG